MKDLFEMIGGFIAFLFFVGLQILPLAIAIALGLAIYNGCN